MLDGKGPRDAKGGKRSSRFIKEGITDAQVTETMLDEAFSQLMETEVI